MRLAVLGPIVAAITALGCGSSNVVFVDAQSIAIANIRVIVRDAQM